MFDHFSRVGWWLLGGFLASMHFILIFWTTWLGVGPSFANLEHALPEKKGAKILLAVLKNLA